MEITLERILWMVGGIALTVGVITALLLWGQNAMMRADFAVVRVEAYGDGTVYITVKNTGTIPITGLTVDGRAATGTFPLEGGQERQYTVTGLSLSAGQMHSFTVVASFSDGQTVTQRRKAVVKSP